MLDNTTKKNIDDCRDVLVGKVPDPKSQIEQITLALIYKFMDDMDMEAVEKFKGKPKFFTGEYAKYGWRRLFDPALSGSDMLALYSEALEKLNTNPNIPELFRNIFKNAYLPYRDPGTLKLFLKYINEFEYSHSEKLGDAFEYLLSVMGSQGDAGQFRTPRNIIDFVTACVNPQKNETVLDPACGTAGFLLSAYKHILHQNTDKRQGDRLTPDQRKKLAANFAGYDISPDMVRLSLANMYLHGFTSPTIHEYDTLSSEDRWNETYDVILANPPFMTPKGGIRPHKKFGVQANKAEVLFTDYIAEHLNTNGRAGIIVPNGIVATTQTAYKQLRKLLVADSLIAVVSLPAGCFNPYSGVKTSVLLLDKQLSKKSNHILFLKIENDGFDLGAQRREHDKNDLPLALEAFNEYKTCLAAGKPFDIEKYSSICLLVEKEKVLENKDLVLTGDRYTESSIKQSEYDFVEIGQVCRVINGRAYKQEELLDKGKYLVLRVGNFFTNKNWYYSNLELPEDKYCDNGDLLYAWSASFGPRIWEGGKVIYHYHIWKLQPNCDKLLKMYLYYLLLDNSSQEKEESRGSTMLHLTKEGFEKREIPLPPLEIQQQIVAEIEGYQKIIDGAKQVVNNYKPTISINPEWEMVELRELATHISSGATPKGGKEVYAERGVLFIRSQNILWGKTDFSDAVFIDEETHKSMKRSHVQFNDVFLNITGASIGRSAVMNETIDANVNQHVVLIRTKKDILNPYFLSHLINSPYLQAHINNSQTGAARQAVNYEQIKEFKIPFPGIEEQTEIVKRIQEEQTLVNANKRLVTIFEQKIKDKINEVWGVKQEAAI
ncbi:MAG: N-6 DNA methylase [Flavipsychrobacter sp.]|nr:N-6 DNA methylase [Flavipsychrobacter sp.]